MLSLAFTLLASLVLEIPMDPAALELAAIQRRFGSQPRTTSEAQLDGIASRSARARVWLGNLALEDGDLVRAQRAFSAATGGTEAPLALRGLGDVAAARGRWGAAVEHYDAALVGASAPLAVELRAKRAAAAREQRRRAIEIGCWVIYLGFAALLVLRSRGQRLVWPVEASFLLPVYAVFLAAASTHGGAVVAALAWIAGGSLGAVALVFAIPLRRAYGALLLALAMTAASIYVGLHRSGLLAHLTAQ
ncbi:MAG: hypothetical protein ABI321_12595 [Polyangia bacterium]